MKLAVVRLSDLVEHGRWDAAFHITAQELRERVGQLRLSLSDEEAYSKVHSLGLREKLGLSVLLRGTRNNRSMTNDEADKAAAEYPHLALAIVERDVDDGIRHLRQVIEKQEEALDRLLQIAASRPS